MLQGCNKKGATLYKVVFQPWKLTRLKSRAWVHTQITKPADGLQVSQSPTFKSRLWKPFVEPFIIQRHTIFLWRHLILSSTDWKICIGNLPISAWKPGGQQKIKTYIFKGLKKRIWIKMKAVDQVRQAFSMWERASPLSFRRSSGRVNIEIRFSRFIFTQPPDLRQGPTVTRTTSMGLEVKLLLL